MTIPALENFSLVGGTALSLRYGHRTSIDLDLFSDIKFNNADIEKALFKTFGDAFVYEKTHKAFGVFCYIENIKVDIVHYPHAMISPCEIKDGIRMYDSSDIAAMKVQAILGRGKKKDFWDIYELLRHFSVVQIIEWHKKKFPSQMLLISIPEALVYFTDAEESDDPVSLKGQTWTSVKKEIQKKVSEYLKY